MEGFLKFCTVVGGLVLLGTAAVLIVSTLAVTGLAALGLDPFTGAH